MENNLFIKETWVNESEGYCNGESGWYETFTDNVKTLFRHLQKEYGKASKMYIDTDNGTKQIGWVFSKKQRYEDTRELYDFQAWVEISTTEPKKHCTTENITYPFKA